ncbi:helix-turn-helix domain-containing protein [Litoribrevibacter euphylliae]|uniref:Helix-turn-helix domain-containing protein n=1 Tax=Litoribrevibacter euphylliae TaxID=1834034 RepID=A0ABV7HFT3_9GAMM
MGHKHITDQYLEAWNNHDADAILACFHPDGVYIDANLDDEIPASLFALRAQELFDCFPNLTVTIDQRNVQGEGLVASPWRLSGVLPGKELSGVDMLCIRENKLQSVQVYFSHSTGRLFAKVPSLHLNYRPHQAGEKDEAGAQSAEKYRTSGLTREAMLSIQQQLETVMAQDKVFLQPELSLSHLADQLSISTNHLSQVVNSLYHKNFHEFVNHHRIAFAKQLLDNDHAQRQTSLVLSLESGFRSTSTFYSAFKKETGVTPSEYRQSLMLEDDSQQ